MSTHEGGIQLLELLDEWLVPLDGRVLLGLQLTISDLDSSLLVEVVVEVERSLLLPFPCDLLQNRAGSGTG